MKPEQAAQMTALLRSREAAFPTYESVTIDQATHKLDVNSHHLHSDEAEVVATVLIPWLDKAVAGVGTRPAPVVPPVDQPSIGTFAGGRPPNAGVTTSGPLTAETEADVAEVPGIDVEEGRVVLAGGLTIGFKQWSPAAAVGTRQRK